MLMLSRRQNAKGASNERAQECPIDAIWSRTPCEADIGTGFNARGCVSSSGRFLEDDLQMVGPFQERGIGWALRPRLASEARALRAEPEAEAGNRVAAPRATSVPRDRRTGKGALEHCGALCPKVAVKPARDP